MIPLLQKCLHCVGQCVQQTGTTGADNWTEAPAKRVLQAPPSVLVQLGKQSMGCATWQSD